MRPRHLFPCIATIGLLAASSTPALAFERLWHAGVDGGWGAISWHDNVYGGFGGGAHLTYGLRDDFNAMLEASVTSHPVYLDRPQLLVASGAVGASYTLDVIAWVPYFGVLVGGYRFSGAELEEPQTKLGFQGALGLDYRFARDFAAGAQVRYHTLADDPFATNYMTAFLRVEYLWGW